LILIVDADAEQDNLMAEWEEYMEDFVPADMITFDIASRS
jgi:hypothetical protein